MGFAIFFFLAWLFTGTFVVQKKELSIMENTFVFLITMIVIINFSWITIYEKNLIDLSKNSMDYTAYLLERSIVIPMVLLLQVNILLKSKTFTTKALIIVISLIIMLCFSVLSTFYSILVYKNWNYFYDAIYYLFLQLVAFGSFKLLKKVNKDVVEYS